MWLFTRDPKLDVRSFMLKLVNNNCPDLKEFEFGNRAETRVRMTVVTLVIPFENKKPDFTKMFAAVTKEVSSGGASLVLSEPRGVDEVILAFRHEGNTEFVYAKAVHLSPMGAGFYQLGLQYLKMVHPGDYPGLADITF
ncbi:MAG: hypothetical protein D6741_20420 [Planctomycetota bacterium]|nr:MAG: hypothetical protein D6741_20420 [Planctomycetota bacterium]